MTAATETAARCQALRNDPASFEAETVLRARGLGYLATSMREAAIASTLARGAVEFLVDQRGDEPAADGRLEALISDAQAARDAASARFREVASDVAAVADAIEAEVPGASTADLAAV